MNALLAKLKKLERLRQLEWLTAIPAWAMVLALLVVKLLGVGRTLLVLLGAAGGYLFATRGGD